MGNSNKKLVKKLVKQAETNNEDAKTYVTSYISENSPVFSRLTLSDNFDSVQTVNEFYLAKYKSNIIDPVLIFELEMSITPYFIKKFEQSAKEASNQFTINSSELPLNIKQKLSLRNFEKTIQNIIAKNTNGLLMRYYIYDFLEMYAIFKIVY